MNQKQLEPTEASFAAICRIAGPEDPIYQSGLAIFSIHRPRESTLSGQEMKAIVERMRRDPKYKQE